MYRLAWSGFGFTGPEWYVGDMNRTIPHLFLIRVSVFEMCVCVELVAVLYWEER